MWRRPVVWIVLVLFSLAGAVVAGVNFGRAFPVVALDLEMDREGALEAARARSVQEGWPTAEFRQAASFGLRDSEVQTYVELEGGGGDGWQGILEDDAYRPYVWVVRQFREGEAFEASVRIAPDGTPVGFRLQVPEDEPGPMLRTEDAQAIAEAGTATWGVDLEPYTLVETSGERRPNGRVDYTFVYERDGGPRFGEARTRLRLVVSGDRHSELTHLVEVPEAFSRRYSEIRSTNDLIALIASLAFAVLYFGGGCGFALLLLLRAGWVEWRTALRWGVIIGAFMFVAGLNELPLAWMDYDTAVPAGSFLTQQVLFALGTLVGIALLLALAFMAAETMDRKAFGGHVRLWRSWDADVARSNTGLGLALGGYVFTGFFVAYVVLFYLVVARGLGWWTPAEAVVEPDLLATPFPWVSGVAISLYAGFSEEALFRAIPLAGAALLGDRFGNRRAWIGVALVVQALIFAAAHANYPQQPAYARLVELFLPALALGVMYLRFGLLPAVIAHFTYDLTWFSLPLFASGGVWGSKLLVVVLGLVPLGAVLAARWRAGAAAEAPESAYNRAWKPAERGVPTTAAEEPWIAREIPATEPEPMTLPGWLRTPWVAAAGVLGLVVWVLFARVSSDAPALAVDREEARVVADSVLAAWNIEPGDEWRLLMDVHAQPAQVHRFVWQTSGGGFYLALLGDNLPGPHWHVRWARFEGPVEERAEEYLVTVGPYRRNTRLRHTLPEGRAAPSLTESEARVVARRTLGDEYGMPPEVLREVSAEADQLPERMDWTFTFRTPAIVRVREGEARASVQIAGDQVVDVWRFIHVPETWEREDRGREVIRTTLRIVGGGLLGLLGLAVIILGAVRWSRGVFHRRAFATVGLAAFVLLLGQMLGRWPSTQAAFSTAQPYDYQLFAALIAIPLGAVIGAALLGVMGGFAHAVAQKGTHTSKALPVGIALGLLVAGGAEFLKRIQPRFEPVWADYAGAAAVSPVLDTAIGFLWSFLGMAITALALVATMKAAYGGKRAWAPVAIAVVVGLGMTGLDGPRTILLWLFGSVIAGATVYAVYYLAERVGLALLPAFVGLLAALDGLVMALRQPYAGAQSGALLGMLLVVTAAAVWSRYLAAPLVDDEPLPAQAVIPETDR